MSEPTAEQLSFLSYIHKSVIGSDELVRTPFGLRPMVYADYTASGRSLSFVEDYVRTEVLPVYGNTHTLTSASGLQTTNFREEARQIVLDAVHGSKDDVVLFAGSGSTAAVLLLAHVLGLQPATGTAEVDVALRARNAERVVVFHGPFEHHSNILPWRESGAKVVEVPAYTTRPGLVNMEELARLLAEHADRELKVCTFSAASNITGVGPTAEEVAALTALAHEHGALSFWDYAAAAPYVPIDMNPDNSALHAKDAIFLSPHKFVGGVQTPGVLVVKKSLLNNPVPNKPGGGTVFFVTSESHTYFQNFTEREEGGTPSIVGAVRCGLAFQLKQRVGAELIEARELRFRRLAVEAWAKVPEIDVLGVVSSSQNGSIKVEDHGRVSIMSFMIRHAFPGAQASRPLFLHYHFVASLLNDLFGIQARGGCSCAGPFAQNLLGISLPTAHNMEEVLVQKHEIIRPGFVRINFNYFISDEEFQYIVDAVTFVAQHGWKFLPLYSFEPDTGVWTHRHQTRTVAATRRWLGEISYENGRMEFRSKKRTVPEDHKLQPYLDEAHQILEQVVAGYPESMVDQVQFLHDEVVSMRWFLLPSEAHAELFGKPAPASLQSRVTVPGGALDPARYVSKLAVAEGGTDTDTTTDGDDSAASPAAESNSGDNSEQDEDEDEPNPFMGMDLSDEEEQDRPASSDDARPKSLHAGKGQRHNKRSAEYQTAGICKNCFHFHDGGDASRSTAECWACSCITYVPRVYKDMQSVRKLERKLTRHVGAAIRDFGMIKEGDRVMVALSGGKDSLTLLHTLLLLQKRAPIRFEVGAATVDPQTPEYNPRPLIGYLASIGVPYFFESQPILANAKSCLDLNSSRASICAFCARMKRGVLYNCCRRENYNVLAMGQHLDDLAESLLMSIFHNGVLRTMKANYHAEAGDIRIIRPLVYTRERLTREYANVTDLPIINENCPACFEQPKERARLKTVLAQQEHLHPAVFQSLLRAMKPLMAMENRHFVAPQETAEDADLAAEEAIEEANNTAANPPVQLDISSELPTSQVRFT